MASAQDVVVSDSVVTSDSIVVPDSVVEPDTVVVPDSVAQKKVAQHVFDFIEQTFKRLPQLTETIADSLNIGRDMFEELSRRKQRQLILGYLGNQLEELNNVDSLYITPQLYDYTVMLQNTTSFESFSVSGTGDKKQTLRFAPKPTFRLGGYFGWRWIFLGYTFDVGGLFGGQKASKQKTEMDLSLYTSKIGIDLYYRKTGNDFRCTNLNDLFSVERPRPEGISSNFDGISLQTRGINLYYIFNHRHFSYPAAFAQSTVQRRSCGTFKLGLSLTHHKVAFDRTAVDPKLEPYIDTSIYFDAITYNDYSINFGYAYNWVFARDFLFCASFSPGIAYTVTHYNAGEGEDESFKDFSLDRLNMDFIMRLGLVYNNTKYYAGMSFILHSFDYKNKAVRLNNSFGSLNIYLGFNFKRKKNK